MSPDSLLLTIATAIVQDHSDQLGVRYRPDAWYGQPLTASERMGCSRLVHDLERFGLLTRIIESDRDRVTHLRPTLLGLLRMFDLAQEAESANSDGFALASLDLGDSAELAAPVDSADEPLARDVDMAAVLDGLRQTDWGRDLATRLERFVRALNERMPT